MNQPNEPKIIVGSDEWCCFPSLNIPAVKARVDSGAKTSSLHAINIQTFSHNGELWASFDVHPLQENRKITLHCQAQIIDQRIIKSSSGDKEKRPVIRVPLTLGEKTWQVEVTLTDRDSMGYRMLLGREAMNGRILVDPEGQCLLGDKQQNELADLYKAPEIRTGALKIGLLASNRNSYTQRRIIEAAEARGHDIKFLNIKDCSIKLNASSPQIHYRDGQILTHLDVILPRIKASMTSYACTILRHFESLGIPCVNSSNAILPSTDKLRTLQLMLNNDLAIPTTGFADAGLDTDQLIDMVGGAPLIIKLLHASQGKNVVLAETRNAADNLINTFRSLATDILIQEFIQESSGKNLRCLVIDGRVVAAIQREVSAGEYRANTDQEDNQAKPVKLTTEEKRIAVKAAKAMELKIAGVDMIRSNKGPLVLDVNASPGLQAIETATNEDIASKIIMLIEKKFSA